MRSICSIYREFGFVICRRTVNCFRPRRRTVDGGLIWHYGTRHAWLDLTLKAGSATMTNSGHAAQIEYDWRGGPGDPGRRSCGLRRRIVIMQSLNPCFWQVAASEGAFVAHQ
jgi:hypothetical protein